MQLTSLKYWLSILLVLGTTLGSVVSANAAQPTLESGSIDLSNWDPHEDGALGLNGDWAFFWNELVSPETVATRFSTAATLPVPGGWNTLKTSDGIQPEAYGHATYVLKITGLKRFDENQSLGMVLPPIASAFKAWWITGPSVTQQHLLSEKGVLELDNTIPQWAPIITKVPQAKSGEAYLVIQVINKHFWLGGIFYPAVSIRDHATLNRWFDGMSFLSMIVLGFIFMMALYHFGLFLLRPQDRASLIFSLFCAVMFIQSILSEIW